MHIRLILINARNSAHDLSITFSPCMSNPHSRRGYKLLAYVIPSYRTYLLMHQQLGLAYYAHVTVDSDKPCCVPLQISKSAVCCLLRLARQ